MSGTFERIATTKCSYIFETKKDPSALLVVRTYERGNDGCPMATVTLETPGQDSDLVKSLENMDLEDTLKSTIGKNFSAGDVGLYPTIQRCLETPPYLRISGMEYQANISSNSKGINNLHLNFVALSKLSRLYL